ncbi:MAG: hypothetical protein IAE97_10445 [Chthoniobacterales bacterium]|nr:hypothetical protein [Chthoniobacterales bacterium]
MATPPPPGVRTALGCAAALALSCSPASSAGYGSYVLNEKFNGMAADSAPADWTTTATSGSVAVKEVPFAQDKSVRIQKLAASGESSLSRTFPAQGGRVVVEAKVMIRETAGFKALPYIYGPTGGAVVSVGFQNGQIVHHNGTSFVNVGVEAVADDWYMIRIVIDTTTNKYDLFVDGVRKIVGQTVRNVSPTISRASFYLDGSNTGTVYVDNVKVYNEAEFIGPPPEPVLDVRDFGATGNGTTLDTSAIQAAIDACEGTGGSVYLSNGTFLSGMLRLKSDMTFFIDSSASLKSSQTDNLFPKQSPPTNNNQLLNCRRALLYAEGVSNLCIDGGGSIDGSGIKTSSPSWVDWGVKEAEKPISIWAVLCSNVTIQNIYIRLSAMWTVVGMETDNLVIRNLQLNVDLEPTRDGIDIVDCHNGIVQDCTVYSGDDSFCFKTGTRRGVDNFVIRDCFVGHTGANSYKFGTASYGAFRNILIEDCYAKNVRYGAMVLMSRNGAEIDNINFRRVEFSRAGSAFYVFLGQQPGHPAGDVDKMGTLNNVHFTDIKGLVSSTWGSLITGHLYQSTIYRITNLFFTDCDISFPGGLGSVPGQPAEWNSSQYPEANMFGNLPGSGYYLRHVHGVTFFRCTSTVRNGDARPVIATNDVSNHLSRTDTDGDSLPNDWETLHFGGSTAADPQADSDGDGYGNRAEYLAGTNPRDPADRPGLVEGARNGGAFSAVFRSVPGKRYQAETLDDPGADSWQPFGSIRAASGNTLTVFDDSNRDKRLYRLRFLED